MTHRTLLGIAAAICIAGPLAAGPISFYANLNGASESPATPSPGTGLALVTIDPTAHTLDVSVTFSGLLAGNTASHIHVINGPGDANLADTLGPVATTTPTFPGFPGGVTSGTYHPTAFDTLAAGTYRAGWLTDSGGTAAGAEAALFAGIMEGRAYLNIHSSSYPGGEIRGFLQAVPEPGSVVLALSGFAGIAVLSRRRMYRKNR